MNNKKIAVIGLGYVGLPLAIQAAKKLPNVDVVGYDINKELVTSIKNNVSPYPDDQWFNNTFSAVQGKNFTATTNESDIAQSDITIICVPTPTNNNIPNLTYVRQAAQTAAQNSKKGQLIVLESTVNPSVTRAEILPIVEQSTKGSVGVDFFLAHCPERIDPGNQTLNVSNLNRVVGGVTLECTKTAAKFYRSIIDAEIVSLDSVEEAEFVKSWENSHRNVMIAMANQAAIICDSVGMDVNNILRGLQTKVDQFGLQLGRPGIGPGGHCIPEDIHYVIRSARSNGLDTRLLDGATDVNEHMPQYAVRKLESVLNKNQHDLRTLPVRVAVMAYKPNVAYARRSPAVDVAVSLTQKAKTVLVHDPHIESGSFPNINHVHIINDFSEFLQKCDVIFLATPHTQYFDMLDAQALRKNNVVCIFDSQNVLKAESYRQYNIAYSGVGVQ